MNVTEALRQAIRDTGETLTALDLRTGVSNAVLSRFMRDVRGLTTDTADKLCAALRLECRLEPRRGKGRKAGKQ
jgi:DNA-binding Xre family transcriptional regulator